MYYGHAGSGFRVDPSTADLARAGQSQQPLGRASSGPGALKAKAAGGRAHYARLTGRRDMTKDSWEWFNAY